MSVELAESVIVGIAQTSGQGIGGLGHSFVFYTKLPFVRVEYLPDRFYDERIMLSPITDIQWQEFEELGYLKIGRIEENQLRKLQTRIDEIMLGKARIDYTKLLMQLDSTTGAYEDAGEQTLGFKGATLDYRKIQELEHDSVFLEYLLDPVFRDICDRTYGDKTPVALFRAMFMNKPANRGTFLPWHQDRWTDLDRDPKITVWSAIDPATKKNGCVQVIPGSHQHGLINPTHPSGFLSKAQAAAICTPNRIVYLELEAGEVALLHNYLLHASDVNRSPQSRRAFSVCYMEAATLKNGVPGKFPAVFGEGELAAVRD
jgi:phytanoyl-CoA hydroxylase